MVIGFNYQIKFKGLHSVIVGDVIASEEVVGLCGAAPASKLSL